mmetsp:Transcript_139510/g.433935  ORF Transcript_139510/g.433935 Transcript_139510/m.433935 type:complete len:413 (-) Transcript_139510:458-1696(-)
MLGRLRGVLQHLRRRGRRRRRRGAGRPPGARRPTRPWLQRDLQDLPDPHLLGDLAVDLVLLAVLLVVPARQLQALQAGHRAADPVVLLLVIPLAPALRALALNIVLLALGLVLPLGLLQGVGLLDSGLQPRRALGPGSVALGRVLPAEHLVVGGVAGQSREEHLVRLQLLLAPLLLLAHLRLCPPASHLKTPDPVLPVRQPPDGLPQVLDPLELGVLPAGLALPGGALVAPQAGLTAYELPQRVLSLLGPHPLLIRHGPLRPLRVQLDARGFEHLLDQLREDVPPLRLASLLPADAAHLALRGHVHRPLECLVVVLGQPQPLQLVVLPGELLEQDGPLLLVVRVGDPLEQLLDLQGFLVDEPLAEAELALLPQIVLQVLVHKEEAVLRLAPPQDISLLASNLALLANSLSNG